MPAVFVELKATTSEFTAKMKDAQAEIKKTADTAQSNSDRMAQVGKVAFAGLAAAAVGFGAIAVKAALEGQQAHAQLVTAVQNSGTAFASVGGQVEEMSGRFAKLGFENDQVDAALARLVQSTGNVSASMREMGLVADFARARHIGLEEAATVVGKVMNGNMTVLQRMGIATKDAAGNTLTAAAALQMLSERFGGAAQANASTYAGKLQALNAEWHNMVEQVGNMLLPVLANVAGKMADVAGWFDQHRQAALILAGIIGGPLVIALNAFIAKQTVAFALSTVETVKKIGAAIMTLLVPATEAEEVALTGAATAEAFLTAGLSVAAGAVAIAGVAFLNHAAANKDVASTAGDAQGAVDGLTGGETALGGVTSTTTSALKTQSDLFSQLNGDFDAQGSEILKLIGDQQSLDRASKALGDTTKANTQAQKDAKTAADNLGKAQKTLNEATDTYNKLQAGVGQAISKDHVSLQHNLTQAQLSNEEAQKKVTDAVLQYGEGSFEARQANLDLESSYITLQDAQGAMGTEGEAAWKAVDDAQQKVVDAKAAVQDALDKQLDAVTKMKQPSADVAANTLAWQQAQNTLNTDWGAFNKMIEDHPEMVATLAGQVQQMKNNLPKGADTKPLDDILTMLSRPLPPKSLAAAFFDSAPPDSGITQLARLIAPPGVTNPSLTGGGLLGITGSAGPPAPAGTAPAFSLPAFGAPRAAGGPVLPGGTYLVGENGPEYLRMGSNSGTVIPGAGGINVQININGYSGDKRELALAVRDELINVGRNLVGVGLG
jgi:hypothetical protein